MAATPKTKPPRGGPSGRADRTSTVVAATLIGLTALGVVTVFWEPLAAFAGGGSAVESMGEARPTSPDAGASSPPSGVLAPAGGAVDASGSS